MYLLMYVLGKGVYRLEYTPGKADGTVGLLRGHGKYISLVGLAFKYINKNGLFVVTDNPLG